LKKNNKNSIQQFIQRNKKVLISGKSQFSPVDKHYYISTEVFHQKTILFCSWHPRKFQGYYSTRNSLNFLVEQKGYLTTREISHQNVNVMYNKNPLESLEITSIDFNLNGTLISTTFYNGLFIVWTETGIPLIKFFFIKGVILESKWCENSRNIALAYLSGEIKIWSTWYAQTLLLILPHRNLLISLNWKKPEHLIAFSKEKILSNLDLSSKKIILFRGHDTQINDSVYLPTRELVGSCSDDLTIKLWFISRRFKLLMTFKGHEKEVLAIAFKPAYFEKKGDFKKIFLASGSLDFSLRIWDLNSKTCVKFIRIEGPVFSIEWALFADSIMLGSSGKVFRITFNNEKVIYKEMNGNYGIFSLNSHSMITKYLGFSFKKIFLI